MKLASHNSFTYAKPVGWFSRLFCFAARCQRVDIGTQFYDYNVRLFDLRVFPTGDSFLIKHGPITFDSSAVDYYLGLFECIACYHGESIYIRVILEQNGRKKNQEGLDAAFRRICARLEAEHQHLKFVNGRRKYDWKVIYEFATPEPSMTERYSSVTNLFRWKWLRRIDDLWPWLYARLMNRRNLATDYDTEFLMIDFVDLR